MRRDLDHLPTTKQRELSHVVRVLFEEFEETLKRATQPWKKQGRILKLVLYGSYARGDWVEDAVGGYTSDYDILIVVNDERLTDLVDHWAAADDRLMRE
jgi:predicted nucleotidyltransferase